MMILARKGEMMAYRIEGSCIIGVPDPTPLPLYDRPSLWERLERQAAETNRKEG